MLVGRGNIFIGSLVETYAILSYYVSFTDVIAGFFHYRSVVGYVKELGSHIYWFICRFDISLDSLLVYMICHRLVGYATGKLIKSHPDCYKIGHCDMSLPHLIHHWLSWYVRRWFTYFIGSLVHFIGSLVHSMCSSHILLVRWFTWCVLHIFYWFSGSCNVSLNSLINNVICHLNDNTNEPGWTGSE